MTKYEFTLNCGSKKGIVRLVEAERVVSYISELVAANLEKEAQGKASIFIVEVLRLTNDADAEPVSVRNKVLTAYYAEMRELKNEMRERILFCKENGEVLTDEKGKITGYSCFEEYENKVMLKVYYPNGLLKSCDSCVVKEQPA